MIVFRLKNNYGFTDLYQDGRGTDTVGVFLRDGEVRYMPWRGSVEASLAKRWPGTKPVKLQVFAYSLTEWPHEWVYLQEDEVLQGCWLATPGYRGCMVYGVTVKGVPRVLTLMPRSDLIVSHELPPMLPARGNST